MYADNIALMEKQKHACINTALKYIVLPIIVHKGHDNRNYRDTATIDI